MREILFRGKRIDNGEWVEGYLYVTHTGEYEIGRYNGVTNIERWTSVVDPTTIGQYTGLTDDKNGKRIFEGDIVHVDREHWKSENKCDRERFNALVWYCEDQGRFGLKGPGYYCLPIGRLKGDKQEVIGNIHDNPKLLGGGEA